MTVEAPKDGWKHEAALLSKDGETLDITGELALMYDLVINSMNWGSGFFSDEDMLTLIKIGQACGFEIPQCGRNFFQYRDDDTKRHGVRVEATGHCELAELHQGLHQGHVKSDRWIDQSGTFGLPPGTSKKKMTTELGIFIWNDQGIQVKDAQVVMTLQVEP
jgi:hypothetical protein